MAKRSNPFRGDGKASGVRAGMSGKGAGSNSAVMVTAHMRKRPVRNIRVEDQNPDNAFSASAGQFDTPQGAQTVMGLQRPGDKPANHLKGAISLLNRSRV